MLMAMFAWVFRFAFFGMGNPGTGVWLFVLSCIVYGFAFDFFNISGALYVDRETDTSMRSSAQGLFMMMTNGFGATIGTLTAQAVFNKVVPQFDFNALGIVRDEAGKIAWDQIIDVQTLQAIHSAAVDQWTGWQTFWYIFAGYALVVAILFWLFFPKTPVNPNEEVKH